MEGKDKEFDITPITATEYATAVFIHLFSMLDRKGVLNMKSVGEALIEDAQDDAFSYRDEGAVAHIRALGQGLIDAAPKPPKP